MQNNISNNSEKTINENKNLRDQLKNKITRIAFLESQNMKLEKRISTFVNEKGGLTENQEQWFKRIISDLKEQMLKSEFQNNEMVKILENKIDYLQDRLDRAQLVDQDKITKDDVGFHLNK